MKIKARFATIRGRIVFIYFLLVVIATTIIGVFIINQMEDYYIDSVRRNMTNTVREGTLISSLAAYDDLSAHATEVQSSVDAWARSLQQEIFVVDTNFLIVASNTENQGKSALDILDYDIILEGLSGEIAESSESIVTQTSKIPVMNMAFPIGEGTAVRGVLYLRSDMSGIEENVNQSKLIFMRAMVIALLVTCILGFWIAKSITDPIRDVTVKAERMVQGDFSQEVSAKSEDEIGQFATMFNLLRLELAKTLSEISSEKNKLETVLRHMADGLIATDNSGLIIHANHAALEILQLSDRTAEGMDFDSLMRNLDSSLTFRQLRKECELVPSTHVVESNGFTYFLRFDKFASEGSTENGIIMLLQDITERQKLENMQTDFVANVSHELKTPLTTIKSYTETLLDGALEDRNTAESFLQIIDTEADRMNRLVKDLLQLSRMEHQQEKWHMKAGNLILLVKSCITKVELTAAAKGQHLISMFDPDAIITVNMDKDRIEQVVLNILSNAIKYTGEGGRVDIDVLKDGKFARIVITDNGIGIPQAQLSRVFERFFRVDKARSRAMGGTGLGLSISKQIVEEHGGSIELTSREGEGTKVSILIPLTVTRGISNIE
ncbi:MAG: cell wall metabolism sensor histidine kinase WalK [Clostridia bacterium]|nr:cell wall metabolism sensor histidine kinase WalK [Clostridia bacterium]